MKATAPQGQHLLCHIHWAKPQGKGSSNPQTVSRATHGPEKNNGKFG